MAVLKTASRARFRFKRKLSLKYFDRLYSVVLESSQKEFYKARNNEEEFNKNLSLNEFRNVEAQ